MVLHLSQKQSILTTTYLKEVLEYRFKLKAYPLRQYKQLEDIAEMIGESSQKLRTRMSKSKSLHGLIVDGNFYVHPDSAVTIVKKAFTKLIDAELAETYEL